jgi:hypothetical protein
LADILESHDLNTITGFDGSLLVPHY